MTEDMKAALEAQIAGLLSKDPICCGRVAMSTIEAIAALRASTDAGAQPVAWMYVRDDERAVDLGRASPELVSDRGWSETPLYAHPPADAGAVAGDDTCIMRKAIGPWYDRWRTVDTVICGLERAEQYEKRGYKFDWSAMRESRCYTASYLHPPSRLRSHDPHPHDQQ